MKDIDTATGIVPLEEFKDNAGRLLEQLGVRGEPLVITQHGRAAAVVLSPEAFERLRERERYFEAVAEGLADAEAGRLVEHSAVEQWLRSWGTGTESEPPQCS